MDWHNWLIPAAFLAGGVLFGKIIEHFLLLWLKRLAKRTKWKGDDIVAASLKGYIAFWIFCSALYGVYKNIPVAISDETVKIAWKVLLVIVITSITMFTATIGSGFVRLFSKTTDGQLPTTSLFSNITRIFVYIGGMIVILQALGISITPLITALGVGGLAVALALQDTLSNLFAGVHIIAAKNIHVHDYIKLPTGEEGYIIDITWRNTTIKTMAENIIIVPNTQMASSSITNFSMPTNQLYAGVAFAVHPEVDLDKAEQMITEEAVAAAKITGGVVPGSTPTVRFQNWTESRIEGTVFFLLDEFDKQFALRHECLKRLVNRFKEEHFPMPYPMRTVILHDNTISKPRKGKS